MPKKLRHHWERANYAAMMEDLDTSTGIVLDELEALGLAGNTYISSPLITGAVQATPH